MEGQYNKDIDMGDNLESARPVGFVASEHVATHNTPTDDNEIMRDHCEDDVDMDDDLEFEDESEEHPDITEVKIMHRAAKDNLAIKTFKVHKEVILLPSLHSIYFHPNEAVIPQVPQNLQLTMYFALYNDIAKANFIADKSLPPIINQMIWFYGLDKAHSFSRFFDQVRYNILLMAFVWASKFDSRYCKEGCKEFVKAFFRAWIESLVFQYDPSYNKFARREAFVALWQNSPFEFHFFSARRCKQMANIIAILKEQLAYLPHMATPTNFLQAARRGELDEDIFEKFGAAMTLQWLIGMSERAQDWQQQIDHDQEVDQANIDLKRAKAAKGNVAAAIHFGSFAKDHQMADEFDPFPEDVHPGMSKIDRNEELLGSLLLPIDGNLEHPSQVKDKDHRKTDAASFWVSHEQVLHILQEDVSKPDSSRALAELTVLMNTAVMEPTAE